MHYDCIEYDGDIGLYGQTNTRPCKGTVSSLNAVHTSPFQRCALDCITTSFYLKSEGFAALVSFIFICKGIWRWTQSPLSSAN